MTSSIGQPYTLSGEEEEGEAENGAEEIENQAEEVVGGGRGGGQGAVRIQRRGEQEAGMAQKSRRIVGDADVRGNNPFDDAV